MDRGPSRHGVTIRGLKCIEPARWASANCPIASPQSENDRGICVEVTAGDQVRNRAVKLLSPSHTTNASLQSFSLSASAASPEGEDGVDNRVFDGEHLPRILRSRQGGPQQALSHPQGS